MGVLVVTPPGPVVTWDQVRAHLRMEADDERQEFVMSLAAAAAGAIDGPGGWLGRAIGAQTLEVRLDSFGCGAIRLPYPPLIDIVSVIYIDSGGTTRTLAADQYELVGATVYPAMGASWPATRFGGESVRIRYRAGYPAAGDPPVSTVPAPITVAIGMMARAMFEGLSDVQALEGPASMLLQPLRVYS